MRLGFSVHLYGVDVSSYDARPAFERPHLSMSLAYLHDILRYLAGNDLRMYRMHSRLLPSDPETHLPRLDQVDECAGQLDALAKAVCKADIRLSFHPYSAVVLNAVDEEKVAFSVAALEALTLLLSALGASPESVIVLHVGGVYDDVGASRERFVRRYETLSSTCRQYLALENDDRRFSFADIRFIHERCGVPLVFDQLHHLVLNPGNTPLREALGFCLGTWADNTVPKIHYSTPRSEMRRVGSSSRIKVPTWTEHGDFVNPFEFASFLRATQSLGPFDVMLEAKARDLAVLKLREDLKRFAPDVSAAIV